MEWTHGIILREFAKAHCQPSTGPDPYSPKFWLFHRWWEATVILLCVYSTVTKAQASAWAADSPPPDHVDTDQVQRKCLQTSVWSLSLSWFTSSAPCSLYERNHSPTLRNVYTLSSGPFFHLRSTPAIKMALPQSFPHLPLLPSVAPGW